jgi:alkanesulfonate monooxygenase
MKLGLFLAGAGHHLAAWRDPTVDPGADLDIARLVEVARIAERGLFDMLFLADTSGNWGPQDAELLKYTAAGAHLEPLVLLSALAMATEHIGLVATMSTSYTEPYHVARRFASLDQISGGRAGWNLVTSSVEAEALQFSRDAAAPHADRYERATEFAEVVLGLWDSWEDGAFVRDQASGLFFDPAKRHELRHKGRHFSVLGPLSVPRSPQGRPVIVNAGQSDPGRTLAARFADVVFSVQQDIDDARAFYRDMKARVAAAGRPPGEVSILPGLMVVVGATEAEAQARYAALQARIPPPVGVAAVSALVGLDLSPYPLDGPLPPIPETNAQKARQQVMIDVARRENLTIRQFYQRLAGARAHRTIVGTAEAIADDMAAWVTTGACDGFNILPATMPDGLNEFVDTVVPALQRRGLFRTAYEGRTLRAQLGLPVPENRHTARRQAGDPAA